MKMEDIEQQISHQVYYGWKLSDSLVIFIVRARMDQFPCNQLIHMRNKEREKDADYAIITLSQLLN